MRKTLIFSLVLSASAAFTPFSAQADCLLGEIKWFGMSWVPRNYLAADGSLQAISSNTALYSLIGNTYGGDGRTTFALPDLRGRVQMGQGHAPGLSQRIVGQTTGKEQAILTAQQVPSHDHPYTDNTASAGGTGEARGGAGVTAVTSVQSTSENKTTSTNTGGGAPLSIIQPSLVLTPAICTQGIYPSRP